MEAESVSYLHATFNQGELFWLHPLLLHLPFLLLICNIFFFFYNESFKFLWAKCRATSHFPQSYLFFRFHTLLSSACLPLLDDSRIYEGNWILLCSTIDVGGTKWISGYNKNPLTFAAFSFHFKYWCYRDTFNMASACMLIECSVVLTAYCDRVMWPDCENGWHFQQNGSLLWL
jgi:hypothetical protein